MQNNAGVHNIAGHSPRPQSIWIAREEHRRHKIMGRVPVGTIVYKYMLPNYKAYEIHFPNGERTVVYESECNMHYQVQIPASYVD